MTKQPLEFEGKTYYPAYKGMCFGCEFYAVKTSSDECVQFRRLLAKRNEYEMCAEHNRNVIWQSGEKAKLQYITARLTT